MKEKQTLNRICSHLLINSPYLNQEGLYYGKMGVVLFFTYYSKFSNQKIYDDFATDLFDLIQQDIHASTPINFAHGLSGIAWTVLYLSQQGLLKGNVEDILYEIDQKIQETHLASLKDLSFETGLTGILFYLKERKKYMGIESSVYNSDFLHMITHLIEKHTVPQFQLKNICFSELPDSVQTWNLGIKDGCAGVGLNLLLS